RALALEPRSAEAQLALGTLEWSARELEKAEAALAVAVDLQPRNAAALTRLGAVKLERGDAEAAVKLLGAATTEAPGAADAQLWLGRALLARGETPAALVRLRKAVDLSPAAPEPRLQLGQALERSGALQEAIEAYQAAAAAAPALPDPHERMALLYTANGRCDLALAPLARAIELAPRATRLRVELGECQGKLGKHAEAVRTLRAAQRADPAAGQVLYPLAREVHQAEGVRAALPLYERAVREDPKNAMPHYFLGYAYKERGQRERAVQAFRAFLALKPDAPERRDIEAEIEDLGGAR
ncbi:tetratricopeptide repeat protein, partial [Anaeromyxobacter sp. PSR-1]|uniref:tetratricopeptide repeat protein n=2 Tax=unclassified Anaeromyxobacter TaxID=2620896 RepID=UPI000B287D94